MGCDRDVFLHRLFKNLDTLSLYTDGTEICFRKNEQFSYISVSNFLWKWKIPTLKFKKFQQDWVSFSEIESVSMRLGQFQ